MPRSFGILNICKPGGVTSRRVVDQVAALVRPEKVGHAGTLDSLATGVLVVCVGKATRLVETIHRQSKAYRGRFLLGCTSDTDDITGTVVQAPPGALISRTQVEGLLGAFHGRIQQAPPRISAVHVDGERAHRRARRGEAIEPAPREVHVSRIALTQFLFPEFELEIECGSGTYVRSIGRDIGQALGCGALMTALERSRVGLYRLEEAIPLQELTAATIDESLLDGETAVADLRRFDAQPDQVAALLNGRPVIPDDLPDAIGETPIAIFGREEGLVCLADWNPSTRQLLPRRVFVERD
jgi:tRNA pseudouridine55 synthase